MLYVLELGFLIFPNRLNQCQLHNYDKFLVGYLISHYPATSVYVILLHTNSLIFCFLSRMIQVGQKIPGFYQPLSSSDLISKWSTWLPSARTESFLKYVWLLAVYVYRFFWYTLLVFPLTLLMCRDRKPVLFWEEYVKGH